MKKHEFEKALAEQLRSDGTINDEVPVFPAVDKIGRKMRADLGTVKPDAWDKEYIPDGVKYYKEAVIRFRSQNPNPWKDEQPKVEVVKNVVEPETNGKTPAPKMTLANARPMKATGKKKVAATGKQ